MANLDLSLVEEAIGDFDKPKPHGFQSGTWGKIKEAECEITRSLALVVARRLSPTHIWTAETNWSDVGNQAKWDRSWKSSFFLEHSAIDLAWTNRQPPGDSEPAVLLEVKRRSCAASSQDHYGVLADIAGLAADVRLAEEKKQKVRGYQVFVGPVGERDRTPWLSCLVPKTGNLEFLIEPFNAKKDPKKGGPDPKNEPYWCCPKTGLLHLNHRSGYNKIFGRSTSTKLISVFDRPGILSVKLDVKQRTTPQGFWIVLFRIVSVSLTGTDPKKLGIQQWWP